jgi:hypothetical protein
MTVDGLADQLCHGQPASISGPLQLHLLALFDVNLLSDHSGHGRFPFTFAWPLMMII